MTPERWRRVNQLFHDARELAPEERAAFLAATCADDEALRRELLAMLAAAEEDDHQFSVPVWEKAASAMPVAEVAKMQLAAGQRLGHYEVLNHLESGGMGEVWLAHDTRLGRRVALKLLPARFTTDADRVRRFEQEARATSALNHPNILTVHDIGNYEGAPYIVAEWLEGAELRALLPPQAELLPVRTALEYARQIAAGLAAAHEKDIVHRDLKPENLFVTNDGRVKILDFGLAKLNPRKFAGGFDSRMPRQERQDRLTDSGVIMGTVGYMSPEQVRGEEVDQRSDLFSFGSILYEMLAGQRAFQRGSMAETMAAILKEEPPGLTELSETNKQINPRLEKIVRHCLEKKPELRFQSARDLGFALEALSTPSGARPAEWLETAASPTVTESVGKTRLFDNARLAWMVAAALLIGMLGVVFAPFRRAPAETHVTYTYLPLPEKTSSTDMSGAALSPDGRRVVMVAVTEGISRLWHYSFERAAPVLLPGTEEARYPFWSPNGRSIGFFAQRKLKRIETAGGMPTTLCDAPVGAGGAWSSTGVILFAPEFSGAGLYRVSESGGTAIPVTSLDAARFETGHNHPRFLPDGRHFVFFTQAGQPDYRGIRLGSLDNGLLPLRTSFLLPADAKAEYSSAGYLLLMRGRKILAQPFDPAKLVLSGDPVPVTEQVYYEPPFRYADLSVFGDRMLLYRRGGNPNSQLIWCDRSGKQLATVGPEGDYRSMQLSPDGAQALLDRNDPQVETSDIWQFDLLRETRTRLTSNPGTDTYPIWSPDQSQVAFASNREGVWGIYRVSADGQRFLVIRQLEDASLRPLTVVQNWTKLLKK
ncbi:MAG: protein kinase domain-containing protein [Blastocatellia bacterium]